MTNHLMKQKNICKFQVLKCLLLFEEDVTLGAQIFAYICIKCMT